MWSDGGPAEPSTTIGQTNQPWLLRLRRKRRGSSMRPQCLHRYWMRSSVILHETLYSLYLCVNARFAPGAAGLSAGSISFVSPVAGLLMGKADTGSSRNRRSFAKTAYESFVNPSSHPYTARARFFLISSRGGRLARISHIFEHIGAPESAKVVVVQRL
jgi:hypothetical protein